MRKRPCTCGAEADVRRTTRRNADGADETVYRVICPVCGQLGPAIPAEGREEAAAIAEAVAAAHLAHELDRRGADVLLAGGRVEVEQRTNIAAHGGLAGMIGS